MEQPPHLRYYVVASDNHLLVTYVSFSFSELDEHFIPPIKKRKHQL